MRSEEKNSTSIQMGMWITNENEFQENRFFSSNLIEFECIEFLFFGIKMFIVQQILLSAQKKEA